MFSVFFPAYTVYSNCPTLDLNILGQESSSYQQLDIYYRNSIINRDKIHQFSNAAQLVYKWPEASFIKYIRRLIPSVHIKIICQQYLYNFIYL